MRIVRLSKATPPYNAGELAGFDDATADRLVKSNKAAYHEAEAAVVGDVTTIDTLLGSSALPAILKITDDVTITLGDLVARAHTESGMSVEEWNTQPDAEREFALEDLLEMLRAEAAKRNGEGEGASIDGQAGAIGATGNTDAPKFTAKHLGRGQWKVFGTDGQPVTDLMDKEAAAAEAAKRNGEG